MRVTRQTGHRHLNAGGTLPLTDEQLHAYAPSIFARRPWQEMSAKYAFIPTIDVVTKLRSEGFQPFAAMQSKSRIEGKGEFTKHMIRFRDTRSGVPSMRTESGDLVVPEVLIINGHDGSSAYHCLSGLFRFICENGLIVCDGESSLTSIRHSGNVDGVIDATYELVDEFPRIMGSIENFSRVQLEAPQQLAFGRAALELKYDEAAPITAEQVITPARREDAAPTLWNTFNTVQENLLAGGQRYLRATGEPGKRSRRMTTRGVNSVSENTRLNKALWTLAEEMRKLAA